MRLEERKKEDKYLEHIHIVKNRPGITISLSKQNVQMQQALHSTKNPLQTLFFRVYSRLLHLTVGTGWHMDYLADNGPYLP